MTKSLKHLRPFASQSERISSLEYDISAAVNALMVEHAECKKLRNTADRLLVLATKWCSKNHHDWAEILTIAENFAIETETRPHDD